MLVCPQCQFENPDNHKFCQRCGESLTEVSCTACGASVPTNAENCPYCGAKTGSVWRAILSPSGQLPDRPAHPSSDVASSPPPETTPVAPAASTRTAKFLDPQHRYQLLDPLPEPAAGCDTEIEVKVLDCQPFQPSPLDILATHPEAVGTTIPAIAQCYSTLSVELYPILPQLHDAWIEPGRSVILLEDRAALPPLTDFWADPDILPLQILHWLHEMTELWGVLYPQQCTQSLLTLSNLRVDEDQLICLRRLYVDDPQRPAQLRDLGGLWLLLFQVSQRTQLGSLGSLCLDLSSGAIADLDTLRMRLEATADEIQAGALSAPSSPPMSLEAVPNPSANLPMGIPFADLQIQDPEATVPLITPLSPEDVGDISGASTRLELADLGEEESMGEGDDIPTVVLPMKLITLEDAGRTDIGRQRERNEDFFSIQSDVEKIEGPSGRTLQAKGLYILCDGMGGQADGEVASSLAVDVLKQYFQEHWTDKLPTEDSIREGIYLANKTIYDLNQQRNRSGVGRMGTTLVLVLVQDTHVAIAHVGDSRLYRFSRRRGLEQITVDHEVGQREIQRGVDPSIAYARPDAFQLTQALGPRDEHFVNPDVEFLELNEDLLLFLCSDGLTDNDLMETHTSTHIEPLLGSQISLEQGVNQLIDLANQYNGHDNITVVAIRARVRPNLDQLRR